MMPYDLVVAGLVKAAMLVEIEPAGSSRAMLTAAESERWEGARNGWA